MQGVTIQKPTANSRRSQLLRTGYELSFRQPHLNTREQRAEWAVAYADRHLSINRKGKP